MTNTAVVLAAVTANDVRTVKLKVIIVSFKQKKEPR